MKAAVSHASPFSGTWYPAEPAELRDLLTGLFEKSSQRTGRYLAPAPTGFLVPHAGLVYSGTVAAAAYRHMEAAKIRRVILLGFSHHGGDGGAWLPEVEAFRTPLGEVTVDRDALTQLADSGGFRCRPEAELCDHSVEIQLPLLQRAVPAAAVVPVYCGHLDRSARIAAAKGLASLLSPGTAIVASSDLTHYGRSFSFRPFPADGMIAERLRDLDEGVMDAAGSLSPDVFRKTLETCGATVCGVEPIALLLETLRLSRDEIFQETLDYQTSGEITGDFTHSVSYGALGYFPYTSFYLDPEDQTLLRASAKATIARLLSTGERKPVPPERITIALERHAGAFVSLHQNGELRGCVGRSVSDEPLWKTVPDMALSAALDDPRFTPVHRGEQGLEVEISVLSPFKRLESADEFRVNEHGAMLDADGQRGLLLPQVATEREWTAEQFLDALARKTGVSKNVYQNPATGIYAFRAQVI